MAAPIAIAVDSVIDGHHARVVRSSSAQGTISCGDTRTGSTAGHASDLGGVSPDHTYQFQVATAGVFIFNSCGSSFDTWLRIYDAAGTQVSSGDDDGNCGVHTILTSSMLAPGSYTLLVEGFSTHSGSYTVAMSGDGCRGESTHSSISCGDTRTGSTAGHSSDLGGVSPDNTYQFQVVTAGSFVFNSCGSSYDTWLRIYNAVGTQVSSGDDDGNCGVHTILTSPTLAPGSYTLLVEGFSTRSGRYTVTMSGDGCSDGPVISSGPSDLMMFAKVNTQSTTSSDGGSAAPFTFPITSATINGLAPESNAVSMRSFGSGQVADTAWSEVQAWIAPITPPTHAGSTGPDGDAFWDEFEQVVEMQVARRNPTALASAHLVALPSMFADHTVAAAAAEVEKDFPTKFPTMLVDQLLGEGVGFDASVVPHTGDDFVNKVVMIANIIGWAVSVVSPTAFASKWQVGRARPEEVAWTVHSGSQVTGAPATVMGKIQALELTDAYSFTAYGGGSPNHPSWPAMHSAASSASLYLAVLLDLDEAQLAEAQRLDCAVASFRTLAGVHYESDNMAGLALGQEVIRRELPGFLQKRYGSDPVAVTAKINSVIAAHDWRSAPSCFK